jgi:hypothetical protein
MKRIILPMILISFCILTAALGGVLLNQNQPQLRADTIPQWNSSQVIDTFFIPAEVSSSGNDIYAYRLADNSYWESTGGEPNYVGRHYYPRTVLCLDETRYIVACMGGVKIVNKQSGEISYLPDNNFKSIKTIKKIYFDGWQNLYLVDNLNHKFLYTIPRGGISATLTATLTPPADIPQNIADKILCDAQGNPFTTGNEYFDALGISQVTAANNLKWSLERELGVVFYIDGHEIKTHQIDPYFDVSAMVHYNWKAHKYTQAAAAELFLQTKYPVVVTKFPHEIHPMEQIAGGKNVMVIQSNEKFAYVLHPILGGVYIARDALQTVETGFAIGGRVALGFNEENDDCIGRTIFYNVPIYPFPTATYPQNVPPSSMIWHELPRNFCLTDNTHNPGIKIRRKVVIPDHNGRLYYEVTVNSAGTPPNPLATPDHIFVGYIDTLLIIDSYTKALEQRFNSNAQVIINQEMSDAGGLRVYTIRDGEMILADGEFLQNKQKIHVVGKLDKHAQYTQILYENKYNDKPLEGYIETKYIVPDGIGAWQIVSIIAIISSICVVAFIIFRHVRRKKIQ